MTTTPSHHGERDRLLAAAVADGRITPARLSWYRAQWAKDPQGTAALIGQLASGLPPKAAAGSRVPAAGYVRRSAAASRNRDVREVSSRFIAGMRVQVDQYALNPMLEDAQQSRPVQYAAAVKRGPAPGLFGPNDLPVYLASGADPNLLLELPWQYRHAAAAADRTQLSAMLRDPLSASIGFNANGAPTNAGVDSYENEMYVDRVREWLLPSRPAWSS